MRREARGERREGMRREVRGAAARGDEARGERCELTGVDFLASPCVPSPVSAIRMTELPFSSCGRRRLVGKRAKGAREFRTSLISPKNSTLERKRRWGRSEDRGCSASYPGMCPGDSAGLRSGARGREITTVVPTPTVLSTAIRPPIASTNPFAIERPSPALPFSRPRAGSAR